MRFTASRIALSSSTPLTANSWNSLVASVRTLTLSCASWVSVSVSVNQRNVSWCAPPSLSNTSTTRRWFPAVPRPRTAWMKAMRSTFASSSELTCRSGWPRCARSSSFVSAWTVAASMLPRLHAPRRRRTHGVRAPLQSCQSCQSCLSM